MAKRSGKLARRYARALLQAIIQEFGTEGTPSPAEEVAEELSRFVSLWDAEPELSSSLLNPVFERNQRQAGLLAVAERAGLSKMTLRFLQVVFERDRIAYIGQITASFIEEADAAAGLVQVRVEVAKELDASERSNIESRLTSQIGGRASFDWQIEPELIGGMVISYGGKVVDGSIRGRLERIERTLIG